VRRGYLRALKTALRHPLAMGGLFAGLLLSALGLYRAIPSEYAPPEDRGAFFVLVNGPEGASFAFMQAYMDEIERRLLPLV
jgi:multidrug efflux pump